VKVGPSRGLRSRNPASREMPRFFGRFLPCGVSISTVPGRGWLRGRCLRVFLPLPRCGLARNLSLMPAHELQDRAGKSNHPRITPGAGAGRARPANHRRLRGHRLFAAAVRWDRNGAVRGPLTPELPFLPSPPALAENGKNRCQPIKTAPLADTDHRPFGPAARSTTTIRPVKAQSFLFNRP